MGFFKPTVQSTIYISLLQLIAFTLPVSKTLVPIFIIGLAIVWLINWNKNNLHSLWRAKLPALFILFYLLHVSGLINTENTKFAFFDLEIKLSLFLFPIILCFPEIYKRITMNKISTAFIQGCAAAVFLCFITAIYRYLYTADNSEFFYGSLSAFHHTTYFALYLNFAIIILFTRIFDTSATKPYKWLYLVFIVFFSVTIFFLASRAGILTLLLIITGMLLYIILIRKMYWKGISGVVIAVLISFCISKYSSYTMNRISTLNNSFSMSGEEGKPRWKDSRFYVWKAGAELIKEHPLLGVGTGDIKDVLNSKLRQFDFNMAANKNLNPHNQYLQTGIALGIPAILLLLINLIFPVIHSIRKKFLLYTAFLGIMSINMLFESLLETQSGVIFYGFFNSFLFYTLYFSGNVEIESDQKENLQ